MTTVKISQLTASLGVSGSDLFMSAVGSPGSYVTRKVTAEQIASYVTSSIIDLSLNSISGASAQFGVLTASNLYSSDKIGIATSTPNYSLEVRTNNSNTEGTVYFGNTEASNLDYSFKQSWIDYSQFAVASKNNTSNKNTLLSLISQDSSSNDGYGLAVKLVTDNDTSNNNWYKVPIYSEYIHYGSGTVDFVNGIYSAVNNMGENGNINYIYNAEFRSTNFSVSGNVTEMVGVNSVVSNASKTNIDKVIGLKSSYNTYYTGNILTGSGLWIEKAANNPTWQGQITNNYGIYIEEQTLGTNIYGLLYNHSTAPFAVRGNGNVGIGKILPNSRLDVNGNTTLSGTLTVVADDATINGLTVGRGNSAGSQNTAMGITALASNTAGNYNAAFGFEALKANTSGIANTAIGRNTLSANTSGSYNTAMGNYALGRNIGGNQNIAIGHDCMPFNTSGQYNVAVGVAALYSITNGSYNTAIGQASLASNTANNNTAVGYNSLNGNGAGTSNTAVGAGALQTNSTANNNTAVGYQALLSNTTGSTNTALGVNALRSNIGASYNTAVGFDALYSNNGASNTAVGYNALRGNTTGYWNIAIGEEALLSNTTGYYNVAIGIDALNTATSSFYNIAVGDSALYDTNGSSNVGIGAYAAARQIGTDNVAIGSYAMGQISIINRNSGSNNIAIGSNAGLRTSGSNNIMIGYGAGSDLRSGSNNIFLGYQAYQMNVSDTFILTLGANERMRINSAGNLGVGSSNPVSLLSVGASNKFQVDSNGNIVKLRNVTTSFPSSQGSAGTLLQNDGAGNLSWVASSGLNCDTATNALLLQNNYNSGLNSNYPIAFFNQTASGFNNVLSHGDFTYNPSTGRLTTTKLTIGSPLTSADINFSGSFKITAPESAVESSISNGGSSVSYIGLSDTYTIVKGKNNTYISYGSSGNTVMAANSLGALFADVARPGEDGTISLGESGARWSEVWAVNGSINQSDARQKQQVRDLNDVERAVAVRCKQLLRAYKWNSAVEEKGDAARIHFGILAQDVKAAFEAEGLNADQYAMFCYDEWEAEDELVDPSGKIIKPSRPAGNSYGIRYSQLLAFIIAAL